MRFLARGRNYHGLHHLINLVCPGNEHGNEHDCQVNRAGVLARECKKKKYDQLVTSCCEGEVRAQ